MIFKFIKFYDIIEQFDIVEFIGLIKKHPFYIIENFIINLVILLIFYWFITFKKYGAFNLFSYFFFFILKSNLKEKFNDTHFSVICVYFFYLLTLFIFWQNITGMIPDTLTITAFIILPAHISFTFFITSFFLAIDQKKFKLPRGFLPSGVPVLVGPFLYIVEFISYFIRLFSLAIRLFINILAGHMLLKIFSIIVLIGCYLLQELFFFEIIINFINFAFIFIEYAACMLQAIVLVSLVAIYIDHSLNFFH